MDLQSLYYFCEVAKELNVTSTAKRLFLSQQCLSGHIQRLERYYGVKLFNRKPNFILTYAGEQLLHAARQILAVEENIKLQFDDIIESKRGCIKVGSTPIQSLACIPEILPVFSKKYPNIEVILTELGSLREEERLSKGEIDLHIGIIKGDNPDLISKKLLKNNIYIVVSNQLLEKYVNGDLSSFIERSKRGVSLVDFCNMPFLMRPGHKRLTMLLKDCMYNLGMTPNILFESEIHEVLLGLCEKGMGAIVVTQTFLHYMIVNRSSLFDRDLNAFPIYYKGEPLYIDAGVSYLKSRYLPKHTRYFLDIAERVFEDIKNTHL